jgi:serine/threonine protein kinase
MAPEQVIGCASAESDIYSLAKVVIEMIAGQKLSILLPDAGLDLAQRVRELLAGMADYPVSSSSIDLLTAALEFEPSRRPRSALAFVEDIARGMEAGATGKVSSEATSGSSPSDDGAAGE